MPTISLLLLLCSVVFANVEKTIFLAPPTIAVPQAHPNLDDLRLIPLSSPSYQSVRTHLNASFPTPESPRGTVAWFLLDELNPGQRYEVRICWLATQPTSFCLATYTLQEAFGSPELLTSLSTYAYAQEARLGSSDVEILQTRRGGSHSGVAAEEVKSSILLLEIQAAADYYTLNKSMMENVPPVLVDIILDPYLFNMFPQSLLPTAGYLICIAGLAWFVSSFAWVLIKDYLDTGYREEKAKEASEKKTL